jgi:hypothetical protein
MIQYHEGLDKAGDTRFDNPRCNERAAAAKISNTVKKQADGFRQIVIVARRCQSFQSACILVHTSDQARERLAAQLFFGHG